MFGLPWLSFHAMMSLFRCHVPAVCLLPWKDNTPFPTQGIAAFEDIKGAIASRLVMAYPVEKGRYMLMVDSARGDDKNAAGMGAVLLQIQTDGVTKKPIGYASRQLLKYEHNYPPFLLEMGAACFSMDYFHHYLVGRRFH